MKRAVVVLSMILPSGALQHMKGHYAVSHYTDTSGNTLFGLLAMRTQMERIKSKAKHIVFVSRDLTERGEAFAQICRTIGFDDVIPVDCSYIQEHLRDCIEPCWKSTFCKLLVFNQTRTTFDKTIMLDTDVLAVRNFDRVFKHKTVGMAKFPDGVHNSGALLAEPQRGLFQRMVAAFPELSVLNTSLRASPQGVKEHYSDQSFLRQFLSLGRSPGHVLYDLPSKYNVRSASVHLFNNINLIHFSSQKPTNGRQISHINATAAIAPYICKFIEAAHASLERHPTLRTIKYYGERLNNWGTLVGSPEVVGWAMTACPKLPKIGLNSTYRLARSLFVSDVHDKFTAALAHGV